jgi:predicted nuclease with TOPRIM domain
MKRLGLGIKIKLDLTDIEHNVLLVALDTLEEQLNDIRDDLDTYEDEATNLNRLIAIKNLNKILKDYE